MSWFVLKVAIPLAAWVGASIWIGRYHLIAAQLVLYGGVTMGMVVWFAYCNYTWKRQRSASPMNPTEQGAASSGGVANDWGTPARMPLDYLEPEPLRVSEAPLGQEVYISFTAIAVDLNGTTWVDTDAVVHEHAGLSDLKIQRAEAGYILTLSKRGGRELRFTPRRRYSFASYAPVVRVIDGGTGQE